jgi:hypothetical protein
VIAVTFILLFFVIVNTKIQPDAGGRRTGGDRSHVGALEVSGGNSLPLRMIPDCGPLVRLDLERNPASRAPGIQHA